MERVLSSLTHRRLLDPNSKRNNTLIRGLTITAAATTTIICKSYPSELVKKFTYPARILPVPELSSQVSVEAKGNCILEKKRNCILEKKRNGVYGTG